MFRKNIEKQKKFVDSVKKLWENDHGEEIGDSYNKIVEILSELDMYSANMLVNLIWYQTAQKTYLKTIGKNKEEVKK